MKALVILILVLSSSICSAAMLKQGSCRGVSTPNGYKFVGVYCVDYACSVQNTYIFDTYCPTSVN